MGVMMSGFFLADSWCPRTALQREFSFSLVKWRVRGIVSHESVFVLCVLLWGQSSVSDKSVLAIVIAFLYRCVVMFENDHVWRTGGIGIDGAALILERCSEAVALGDGRDLFSLQAGGQLLNVAGGKCVGRRSGDLVDGGELMFGDCDTASRWEVQGNGQLKLNSAGDFCLSQKGLVPGKANVAAKAAVMASSTANVLSHGV